MTVTIKIMGGLGNQMFQYAIGRMLSLKNKDSLKFDLNWFRDNLLDTPRQFSLDIFKISTNHASEDEIKRILKFNPIKKGIGIFVRNIFSKSHSTVINENTHSFDPRVLKFKGDIYLVGYWQSYKYFKDIEQEIREDFQFLKPPSKKNYATLENINNTNSISVHVRRGDYITNPATNQFHGTCDVNYYKLAVQEIIKHIENPVFYVFSDDPEWCRTNLKFTNETVYVDNNIGKHSWEDMRLMSRCKHNIIANSSFSWWGAWLNKNPEKIVISPKKWFNDESIDTADLYPKEWVKL